MSSKAATYTHRHTSLHPPAHTHRARQRQHNEMLLQQFLTMEIEFSFSELPETSPHWGAVFPSTYHGTRTFGGMLFQFDWGWLVGQPFQIITNIEITSYETSQKSETAAAKPAKLHFGVTAALNIVNIFFSPQRLLKSCFRGGWKDIVCFYLEIYVALIA